MPQKHQDSAEGGDRAERSQLYEEAVCHRCQRVCREVTLRVVTLTVFSRREEDTSWTEETPDPAAAGSAECYSHCCGALLPAPVRDRFLALRR